MQIRDLGSNFFLTEADLGKPRAAVCAPKLAELNRLVNALQPALILLMGVVVGGIIIVMLSAVFSMNTLDF